MASIDKIDQHLPNRPITAIEADSETQDKVRISCPMSTEYFFLKEYCILPHISYVLIDRHNKRDEL